MITWPESLVAELAERRCIIFLGAGASAGCHPRVGSARPPNWDDLLKEAANKVPNGSDKEEALRLLGQKQYLDAAQIIWDKVRSPDLRIFLRSKFKDPNYEPSEIHKIVAKLDAKIVITTNIDDIYETYCQQVGSDEGYNSCKYYETHALNDIRSTVRVILKAHGCIGDTEQAVMTRRQYFNARREYANFYALLDALFLTHSILFVGCGLNDPDIQLVLENSNISVPTVHPHYALTESGRHKSIVESIKTTYNIELLEYAAGAHGEAVDALNQLFKEVEGYRAASA